MGETKAMKAQPNLVHELFAKHLTELGLVFEREVLVKLGRKWRWDFVFYKYGEWNILKGAHVEFSSNRFAVEIDGFHKGRHGAGYGADYEKQNMGVLLGWNPLRFSTNSVKDGSAKAFIAEKILGKKGG